MATQKEKWWGTCKREYLDTLFRLGEVLLAFSSGVMMVVAFGTPYWVEQSFPSGRGKGGEVQENNLYHSGLWQNCTPTIGCESIGLNAASESRVHEGECHNLTHPIYS